MGESNFILTIMVIVDAGSGIGSWSTAGLSFVLLLALLVRWRLEEGSGVRGKWNVV